MPAARCGASNHRNHIGTHLKSSRARAAHPSTVVEPFSPSRMSGEEAQPASSCGEQGPGWEWCAHPPPRAHTPREEALGSLSASPCAPPTLTSKNNVAGARRWRSASTRTCRPARVWEAGVMKWGLGVGRAARGRRWGSCSRLRSSRSATQHVAAARTTRPVAAGSRCRPLQPAAASCLRRAARPC